MAGKRSLLDDTATGPVKKLKANNMEANHSNSESDSTRRGSRSKNFSVPNPVASLRGTQSAKAQGKKASQQKYLKEQFIPRAEEERDSNHERVVFIDNDTGEARFVLYRTTEKAEPMAHLWAQFLQGCQSARDHIGVDALGSFLSDEESAAINLKNNTHIFPTLITSKGALRSKDNLEASTQNAQRNTGGTFTRASATATGADILRSRATSLRKKASALQKQADAYEKAADQLQDDADAPEDTGLGKHGMVYIGDVLKLSRKEVNSYIQDHEDHLAATAEKLRSEMAGLAAFVHRAEKRLRELIQLKIAADYKLCRDVAQFGEFDLSGWQMEALPIEAHVCWCERCTGREGVDNLTLRVPLRYPPGLPQRRRKDAFPEVKIEEESEEEDSGMTGLLEHQRMQAETVQAAIDAPLTASDPSTIDNAVQATNRAAS